MRLFSLRLLLLNVRGPVSFEALKTFNNIVYQTFEAAALACGLLESDNEWDRCLTEASIHAPSAASLCELFVYILTNCSPSEPHRLWNNHRERMSDDYFFEMHYQLPNNETELVPDQWNQIYQRTLGDIDTRLQITGHRLSEFPFLPQDFVTAIDGHPQLTALEAVERSEYITDEQTRIYEELFPTLNDDQRRAFNTVIQAIDELGNQNQSHIFFVNGPGGTGKSLLFKTLLSRVRSQDQIALSVASSGIAAILLPGGRTAHSRFKIPIDANETDTCNLPLGGAYAHLIRQTSLIIWDEAVMCGKWNFQAVDNALRDIMGATDPALANVPFGGKVVAFGGDFRQLLPVVKKGTRSEIVANCISATTFWRHIQILNLTVNMRIRNAGPAATAFANTLLAVGDGRPPYSASYEIPREWVIDITDTATLINAIYPTISDPNPKPEHFSSRAILASTNADVDEINKCAFELFPGDTRQYLSTDRIIDADDPDVAAASYPTEYLQSLTAGGIPSHVLNLKVGMPLILLRNLNPDAGLCNGTKVFVTALLDHSIVVKRIDIGHDGEEHYIPRINMCTTEGEYPFILCRRQFPVRPAFAMTIHKSQGQTLTHIGIRLQEPVFVHSQLYVALSRATDPNNIRIAIDLTKFSSTDVPTTVNIVYHEVLLPSP
ncbi:hypothetical protein INT45_001400 [Circinella minor]|uniref:ATP-dependent DNA helicase n=1 Tax=Circinella minor TaxID=1195481 RepID=A0A8H7RY17_9FUNG|nr:hypothetical protein INT45_001400 [Circinella minor]